MDHHLDELPELLNCSAHETSEEVRKAAALEYAKLKRKLCSGGGGGGNWAAWAV